ncbi:helix-turn-helix domain-containing protein [Allokutzneria albata]|uniref:Helix-turn-helix domain-containing protein n=1 Tax=Allokutzneria albata TaxID=211114 RepID=A0A1H0BM09_ALLAB|nr:helix-turn-helix domain-containing protein [Allokutzneria albata]SDN46679.1 hypothetical protein SAMN04489726_6737 [Allokutzneria albata]
MNGRTGRPENPVDPADGPLARFAHELREVRERAGRPSYQELAKRSRAVGRPYSVSTLRNAASGTTWPTEDVTEAFVRACAHYADSPAEATVERLLDLRQQLSAPAPEPTPARARPRWLFPVAAAICCSVLAIGIMLVPGDSGGSASAAPQTITAGPADVALSGTCRDPVYAGRVTAEVRPCIAVVDDQLRTSVLVRATAPTPEVTVHVWLHDAVGRAALKGTLRSCRVIFEEAGHSALCGPFAVDAPENRVYSTAVSVEYGTPDAPAVWGDAKATGTQSPVLPWRVGKR